MSVARYTKAIQAILDIEQKRSEISSLKRVLRDSLTVNEYENDSYCIDEGHLKLAFSEVASGNINISDKDAASKTYDSPVIIKTSYVTSQILYKDVSISLHSNVLNDPQKALKHLINVHK